MKMTAVEEFEKWRQDMLKKAKEVKDSSYRLDIQAEELNDLVKGFNEASLTDKHLEWSLENYGVSKKPIDMFMHLIRRSKYISKDHFDYIADLLLILSLAPVKRFSSNQEKAVSKKLALFIREFAVEFDIGLPDYFNAKRYAEMIK